jgi:threonine/homoserine/homoserine lactone efflux protein
MVGLSAVSMLLTLVAFVGYGYFAAAIRIHVISRPRLVAWIRRVFAGTFAALGARLAFTDR